MARVSDLTPGDEVMLLGRSAVFVAQTEHPIWPGLRLVVWKLDDGSWSHDALDARQEVGDTRPSTADDRMTKLRYALLGSA